MEKKTLFIDTETGGISPDEASLLSVGFAVWMDGEIIDTKEIFIKHDLFKISPQAMIINKINLLELIGKAKEPQSVINEIRIFLKRNFPNSLGNIVIGGHNTNFDINFLRKFLSDYNINFDEFFSHRFIDTASILKYLFYAGKLELDLSSSEKAFDYFNIKVDNRHSALGDAVATAELFTCLINVVKNNNKDLESEIKV
jgi:DNA polymerase III epsilon subunit-like protein